MLQRVRTPRIPAQRIVVQYLPNLRRFLADDRRPLEVHNLRRRRSIDVTKAGFEDWL
jgi:hypothetical protein